MKHKIKIHSSRCRCGCDRPPDWRGDCSCGKESVIASTWDDAMMAMLGHHTFRHHREPWHWAPQPADRGEIHGAEVPC